VHSFPVPSRDIAGQNSVIRLSLRMDSRVNNGDSVAVDETTYLDVSNFTE